ncbi:MAG: hypothetical protein AAF988_08400, partial [Pseudomonadota bacterium]
MAADAVLKEDEAILEREESTLKADNINAAPLNEEASPAATITQQDIHPLALEAARRLINQHTSPDPTLVEEWGTPQAVYNKVKKRLMDLGYQARMAENMAEKLVEQAEEYAEGARSKYSANIIGLKIAISRENVEPQFSDGALEVMVIDGVSPQAQVAGATATAMGIDTGGTTTTQLRNGVAEILQSFANSNVKLQILFEAPNKNSLPDLANEAAMAALANIAGGDLSPEEIQELMAELRALVDLDALPPEFLDIINNLENIMTLAEGGMTAEIKAQIQELASETMELISDAVKAGTMDAAMAEKILETIQEIGEKIGIENIIPEAALSSVEMVIETQQVKEKIEALIEAGDFDPDALESLLEDIHELDGQDLMDRLDEIKAEVAVLDLPADLQAMVSEITKDLSNLHEKVEASLPVSEAEAALQMTAEEIMTLLESLDQIDFEALSPEQQQVLQELKDALEKLDVDNLTADDIKAILEGNAPPELKEALQAVIVEINKPDVQLAVPQENLNAVNTFLKAEETFVVEVVKQAVVQSLTETLDNLDPASDEYKAVQKVLDKLEKGEAVTDIDPAVLEQVIDQLGDAAPQALIEAVEITNAVQSDPVILSSETLETVQSITGDLGAVVEELQSLKESGEITAEQEILLDKLEAVIERLEADPANIAALAELAQMDQATFEQISNLLPPETLTTIENLQSNVDTIVDIQKEALAIQHDITAEDVGTIAELVNDLGVNKEALIEAGITDIDAVIEKITNDPTSIEAAAEIKEILQNSDLPEAVRETLSAQLESVQDIQTKAIAAEHNLEPAQVEAIVDTVVAMESLPAEMKEALSEAGVDVASVVETIKADATSLEAAAEITKIEQMIADPNTPPEVAEALK